MAIDHYPLAAECPVETMHASSFLQKRLNVNFSHFYLFLNQDENFLRIVEDIFGLDGAFFSRISVFYFAICRYVNA